MSNNASSLFLNHFYFISRDFSLNFIQFYAMIVQIVIAMKLYKSKTYKKVIINNFY